MSYPNLSTHWQDACRLIAAEISELSYKTWIASLEPIDVSGNKLLLKTPAVIYRSNVSKYMGLVQNAVQQSFGQALDIELLLPEEVTQPAAQAEQAAPKNDSTPLIPRFRFENFVIGNSNRFAHAAALAVAESPAEAYNPLFIYGGVGLGKTHLMHAIGHYLTDHNPSLNLLYISSENFTNQLISAIQNKRNNEFRNLFRTADVLLVDDIQFIAGRDSTQEEFFHTFNTLHQHNKQIVISSDKPPKDIPTLEERLRSRFEWGLIVDVQRPDYETRIAILRKKSERDGLVIPDPVFYFIAEKIESNIRELEGSLTRVVAYAQLTGNPITLSLAQEALKDILSLRDPKRITCALVQQVVSDYFQMSPEALRSKKRNREIVLPRQIAMYLLRALTELSLPHIGEAFGGRDHTTVLHACDKIARDIQEDRQLFLAVEDVRKRILDH